MRNSKIFENDILYLALILLASAVVFSPILIYGAPLPIADFVHHLQLGNSFFRSIENGVWYPNWVLEENNGYGSVVVRFYPPLVEYSFAVFRILTGSWLLALYTTFSFWSFVGGSGIYLWTREFFTNKWQSAVAAGLFIVAPYRLSQFYHSYMFGEFAAIAILPFALYFVLRICRNGKISDVAGFAVACALLILSNLPQAVIGAAAIGLYALCNLDKSKAFKQIAKLAAGGLLALSASSFYWLRMLSEMNWINVAQPNTDPNYDFRNNFLLNDFTLDARGVWFASLMFAMTVLITVLLIFISRNFTSIRRDKNIFNVGILFVFAAFMILPLSKFVWENLAFLQKVQFPFRFFSILIISSSVLGAFCLKFISTENYKEKRPIILFVAGLLLIYVTFSAKQVALSPVFESGSDFETTVERSTSQKGLWHWYPVWAGENIFDQGDNIQISGREVKIKKWDTEQREFTVSSGEGKADVRLPILYYPHWHATINDQPIELRKSEDGALALDLPANDINVKIFFVEPANSLLARKISIAVWLILLLLIPIDFFRRKNPFVS